MKFVLIFAAVLSAPILVLGLERNAELRNGDKMPVIGLGTWLAKDDVLDAAVDTALEAGYRHIDTATLYENEHVIGRVIKRWIDNGKLKRDDIFVVTKLPGVALHAELVTKFLQDSLRKLQLDYVDMYLIHTPFGYNYQGEGNLRPQTPEGLSDVDFNTNLTAIWQAMEEQVDAGRTKHIGISNFNTSQIARIVNLARIKPDNLQVEIHAYLQQPELVEFSKKNGLVVTAYSPLGSPGWSGGKTNELNDPVTLEIAAKHNKTAAQVLLRHCIQKGLVCIPKSTTPSRIQENFNVFDFELDSEDLQKLTALDKGESGRLLDFGWNKGIKNHKEYPFHSVSTKS